VDPSVDTDVHTGEFRLTVHNPVDGHNSAPLPRSAV